MTEQQIAAMRKALAAANSMYIEGFTMDNSPINTIITALTAVLVDHALDKKAENARELGLMPYDGVDYEPVQDGQCKRCTDGCPACDARKQPAQQEPVAVKTMSKIGKAVGYWRADLVPPHISSDSHYITPLYTRPQAPEPLTDEQIHYAFRTNSVMVDNGNAYMVAGKRAINIARAIEAAHGITGEKK